MAKKGTPKKSSVSPKTPAARPAVTPPATVIESVEAPMLETPVRKTVAPKAAKPAASPTSAPTPVTYERIAERAYYISISGNGGSETDNWHRAESELRKENV